MSISIIKSELNKKKTVRLMRESSTTLGQTMGEKRQSREE